MRHPATLTRGGFVEGFVPFGSRLTTETALDWLPHGKRAAISTRLASAWAWRSRSTR